MNHVKKIPSKLLTRLIASNSVIVLLVMLATAISVKDYSCYLINHKNVTGSVLISTLNIFLIKLIIVVFFIAAVLLFFSIKKMIMPVKVVTEAAMFIQKGKIPSPIKLKASGELGELIYHFNAMTDSLSSIQVGREEMLKDIAHELRTPLTNINGYLEALHAGVIDGNQQLFGSLLEESRRITRIVDLLTELHLWEKDVFFLEKPFECLHIDKILNESITAFQLQLMQGFDQVDLQIDHSFIRGHKDGLKQVFAIFLHNLVDYDLGKKLSIRGAAYSGFYRITFSHNGLFIDPNKKNLIFERFYRFEESRSTRTDGAGLGLAIAKRIIEAHKGDIEISTNGYDHCFSITLPVESDSV